MTIVPEKLSKSSEKKLLDLLTREVIKGTPYYYKGYKDVVTGSKLIEEISGSSSIQAVLVMVLGYFIKSKLDKTKYVLATNEAGLHFDHKNNLATDLGIFLKEKVTLTPKYFQISPLASIEIDVRIDIEKDSDYISAKSGAMFEFGTKQIVWIMTKPKKIMVIKKGLEPVVYDWNQDIPFMENLSEPAIILNLGQLMEEEGLQF